MKPDDDDDNDDDDDDDDLSYHFQVNLNHSIIGGIHNARHIRQTLHTLQVWRIKTITFNNDNLTNWEH